MASQTSHACAQTDRSTRVELSVKPIPFNLGKKTDTLSEHGRTAQTAQGMLIWCAVLSTLVRTRANALSVHDSARQNARVSTRL